MTEIPTWWLVVSGLFFILQSILVLCLIAAVIKLVGAIKEISPKVVAISAKVEEIGTKVEELTDNVKTTMDAVGARAKSVAGSAEMIAHTAANTFEKFSPAIVGILSALRVLKAVQEFQNARKAGASPKAAITEVVAAETGRKVDRKVKK